MNTRFFSWALVAASLASAGCTTPASPQAALLESCDAYVTALQAVSAAAVRGRLSAAQLQTVTEITGMLNPICQNPPANGDSAAVVLSSVRKGLETILFVSGSAGAAS